MRLTIDIGNTRLKTGAFTENGEFIAAKVWGPDDWAQLTEYATNLQARYIIYSSVANVPPSSWIVEREQAGQKVYALQNEGPLPFQTQYLTMETLGQDRIAAVAGALEMLPGTDCLIADAGTCLTLDVLTSAGLYRGGNISPGLQMRLRAMHQDTGRLPLVSDAALQQPLGLSTETALRHGARGGLVYEIEGLFFRLRKDYPDLRLLLTGGNAPQLQQWLSVPALVHPHLVHYGLYKILQLYAD
ncbi:MAG: type III pantothenate kinase [Bacteroidota bacterium]